MFLKDWALKTIRSIDFDDVDGKHVATIKNIKSGTFSNGTDRVWATGENERRLAGFMTTETCSFAASSGAISEAGFIIQGAKVTTLNNGAGYRVSEIIKCETATTIQTKYTAQGTAGAEIGYIYKCDRSGNTDPGIAPFAQGATASATAFTYATATKTLTLPTDAFSIGDYVLVKYFPKFTSLTEITREVGAEPLSGTARINVLATRLCDQKIYKGQIVIFNALLDGNYDLAFGDNPAVQDLTIEAVGTVCGEGDKYWSFYIGSEEAIVA